MDDRVFYTEPASTSAENALARRVEDGFDAGPGRHQPRIFGRAQLSTHEDVRIAVGHAARRFAQGGEMNLAGARLLQDALHIAGGDAAARHYDQASGRELDQAADQR